MVVLLSWWTDRGGGAHTQIWETKLAHKLSKLTSRHLRFMQEGPKVPLWLHTDHKPVLPNSCLAAFGAGSKTTSKTGYASIQGPGALAARNGHVGVGKCRELCENGRISEAVAALDLLVQRGFNVPGNLYYRALKSCIQKKDLALGKRVHTLTVKSGYEGDAFLATHLIGLYASLNKVEEALDVFTKISAPDAHNWAAIIFAHARVGKANEAIRLYRQMCTSTVVKPDNRLYSGILKACAIAKDLAAGREVHAHILASAAKPDKFVQAGLVNMYVKCGSVEDARELFDKLLDRNIVTWTAMIAGYAQQGMGQEALCLYKSMRQEGLTLPDSVTYVALLQACANVGVEALDQGKQLHAEVKERGLHVGIVLGSSLVNMYAKCGSVVDARRLFDKLPEKNVVAWTAMIAGYAQNRMGQEALHLYRSMQQEGFNPPDSVTYACLLQACASVGAVALDEGKQLHAQIREAGMQEDVILGGCLVNMYAKCGRLEEARSLFNKLSNKHVVTWTALIAGYAQRGMGHEALNLYRSMQQQGLTAPDSVTYVCLLHACASVGLGALDEGKHLHAELTRRGFQHDLVIGGSLVNMYVKCGSLDNAHRLFDKLRERNIVAWTSMIAGYAQQGLGREALDLYKNMRREGLTPDSVAYVCLLQACASVGVEALDEGKQLHLEIAERGLQEGLVLGSSLVNMYAKCGSVDDGRRMFDKLPERNNVAWTALIAGYAQQGRGQEALDLYRSMQEEGLSPPDSVTFVCLLQSCASLGVVALDEGKQLHAQIRELGLEEDVVLGGSLVNMHAKCGNLEDARSLFETLPDRNLAAWNAMIAGYAQQGIGQEAIELYRRMQHEGSTPDSVTYVSALLACASVGSGALNEGKQLHAQIRKQRPQEELVQGASLVNMYAKCGSLEGAQIVFDKLLRRDVVTWTTMIAAYSQHGMGQEALVLYSKMKLEGIAANSVTYVCLLQACAAVAALPLGEQLRAEIQDRGMQADGSVGAALVNMYAKCGSMHDSQRVFDSLAERNVEAWGALVSGYARQGDSQIVFDLLRRMKFEGVRPDEITFLSVLAVCSHEGLVDKGREYFVAMTRDYGISATMEHFICMVDLLGRAGHLNEALQTAQSMPFTPDVVVWHTLLASCRKWKNVEIGQEALKGALSVDETDAASYVLMSNIYASAHMWEAAKQMQSRRMKLGAWKKPGQSWWTDMDGVVHTFIVGDKKHPESESIYARLEQVIRKIKKEGYVPHLESSLMDVGDDKKQAGLCGHSEKLAIAYALSKTVEGTTIRVVKNLRVCEDCHVATAYISKVEQRTIICRDASRFHVFKEGKCSCKDYW